MSQSVFRTSMFRAASGMSNITQNAERDGICHPVPLLLFFSCCAFTVIYTSYAVGVFCLRQSGTSFCWCAVFPRSARKNRTHMIVEYHAAAGRMCFKRGSLRKL